MLLTGCGGRDAAVDPESRDPQVHANEDQALGQVPLREVVAATFGVTTREAPVALERHLAGRPEAAALLAKWPRLPIGGLDLDRPPLAATALYAFVGPGSKSRCGEVTVLFGDGHTTLRARLPIPATARQCRGITRDNNVTGDAALALLRIAIADARVPIDLAAD
ncbi:MAG: hypothetical protein ACXWUG_08230 [Polyangiales bacterium]